MKKIFKITGITLVSILALLFLIPLLIPQTVNQKITSLINKNIKGEVAFKSTSLSFFSHFPSLTLNLNSFLLKGSEPFKNDTLLYAEQLSLGVDLFSLFGKQIKVDKFYIDNGKINILADSAGRANYNVYESKPATDKPADTSSTALKISGIYIKNTNLLYHDKSIPMLIKAEELNYSGTGDLSHAIFDLKSRLKIKSANIYYANTPYLLNKKLNAKLVTKINTNSLDLIFDENNLRINDLPIQFVGRFSFLKDGYDLDFRTKAKETDLQGIFSALPPEIADRMERTKIKGYGEIDAALIGKYMAHNHTMPSLTFNMKIRDGEITNPNTPQTIKNLFLNLHTSLPGLNPDSLNVNMDSLFFNIDKDFFASVTKIKGLKEPEIYTRTRSNINLENWAKIINLDSVVMKGKLVMNINADGKFSRKIIKSGIRKTDTVIATVPRFDAGITLTNGYFKYAALPSAIDKISFNFTGHNNDGDYKNTVLAFNDVDINAMSNYIKGHARLQTINNFTIDAGLKTVINFAEIKNFYPIKDLVLKGKLSIDLNSKGSYNKSKKQFPVTTTSVKLDEGYIKTANFSEALEKINIDAMIVNTDGTLKGTTLNIKPISFEMANQPFLLKAQVNNLDNVSYDIASRGSLDLEKIYKVFAVKGYQVKGFIYTNFSLKGIQSDAMAGRYNRLNNSGIMRIKDLDINTDIFPKSFMISSGKFSFTPSVLKFDEFKASYGSSDFNLNGDLNNYINYVFDDKEKLKGKFVLNSNKLVADEFMVFADGNDTQANKSSTKGVILVPSNLDIIFQANAKQVLYNGLNIKNAKGNMQVSNGSINLKETGFELAGATVNMSAMYKSMSPLTAMFDFKLAAENFDISRAYKEIQLFRDMVSSASNVKGLVGLNYQLSGKLNDEMYPIFPSIKGEGVLTLKDVKLAGFKMMNAVSKTTGRDSLNNPHLKDIEVKSTIKNNVITIERTKMKIAGFRPRFEGQVSFDGKINLSGRLGLPPFGIIGIPLSVTGTQEKPVVKLKRNKEGKLEETEESN
ncbi:AsmA family protein [Pedobacter montanisoli]|uniref:AsmA-like C-terminal region-containing protein n=1 Tax=Pedobacter montanisoli TaxID=2923277 RepID=A0ABS9ZW29_9SPHI|nr:AsmA-like C-terminal region-containing protein [Pedobacter montanisoli]MCJ0742508.1 AsmA-like C-terminal region-containing protein [Pedobacter montanisoli]